MSRLWSVLCALVCVCACVHVMAVGMDSMAHPHRHHKSSSSSPSSSRRNAAASTQPPTKQPSASQVGPNNAFCGAQNIPYNDRTHKCCQHSNKVVRKDEHCPRYVPPSTSSSSQQQVNKRVDSLQQEVDRLRAKEARREAEQRREIQERERRERERREQAKRMLAERERREREKEQEKERQKKKKREQKPKKCGDETFNPATHRCCNCMPARVVPLNSDCPASSSLSARCGGGDGVMYDPSRHKCCANPVSVVDLNANCPPPPRQETSRRLLFQMCGEERCCAQRWTCPERCGSRLFDPDYQGCCNGKAYSLETQFCCNGCVYNKGCGYGCCNGQLFRKGAFTCCPVTLSVVMPGACSKQQTPAPTAAPSNATATPAPTAAPAAAPSDNGSGAGPSGGVAENGASEEVEGAELSGELANELAELAGEESEDSLDTE